MPNQEILYAVEDRVATITLNRPDKLNAWTRVMEQEVRAAIEEAAADDSVRVIVLTGAGRGFCAGADMSLLTEAVQQGSDSDGVRRALSSSDDSAFGQDARPDFRKRYSYFAAIPKPVVAAINGPAVGLGLVIALYCDLRFASSTARFGTAFARRGLIAEYAIAWLLPRLIGHARALDVLLSARIFEAPEAFAMGLVNQVFPQDQFLESVSAYASELANSVSPRSMRIIKHQVYEAMFQTLGESFDSATAEMQASFKCEDFKEGVAHFLEKRAPSFTGR
jgi:enoyl-CoA hydratase/carnithine racemase